MSINTKITSQIEEVSNPSKSVKNVCIIISKNNWDRYKKRKKRKVWKMTKFFSDLSIQNSNNIAPMIEQSSMPELRNQIKDQKVGISSSVVALTTNNPYRSDYIVNVVSGRPIPECLNLFNNSLTQAKWRIYRCQLNTKEETCCCSCNSDAMFEVMKSLYDCYKKKNCDHCNCILCGHLPKEERRLGEMRKLDSRITPTEIEKKKQRSRKADTGLPLESKTAAEKEQLKKLAVSVSEPLEGKTPKEKEKILKKKAAMGVTLPEGRTPSEKSLIQKIKTEAALKKVPPEKVRKAKEAGLLTPLQGKTPEQKEKILRGLAMHGIPLPEGQTPSDKKIIKKVRNDIGLPPEPKTPSIKEKYKRGMENGIITPLEGKSAAKKEKILKAQANLGIPLPEGRTPSEKKLIAKVKATSSIPSVDIPSEKIRRAKSAGLLTPLSGKTPEQKEKILKGLAFEGIPLPEAKTPSEKKLLEKVRTDLGLPPEPKTDSGKERYKKAVTAGIITPLEGKSPAEKEKILRSQGELGLPLPEGRTPSEKSLIEKIKTEAALKKVPSEKVRKAKEAGLLTPLQGKTPEQKEKILRGLAMHGIPLPEGKTPSDKKIIKKVRNDIGLPPEPKTPSIKEKYKRGMENGIITPLEGKSAAKKEKILKAQANLGIPLPEGRTPSEKKLIAKVKATSSIPSVDIPSEKIRRAKSAGLLTPLSGKTPEQKEKILKGLAFEGIPLPEAKTPSEKKLLEKVRTDLGLPPEPKTDSGKERYKKAVIAGIITPLEGKSPAEKKKILRSQGELGLPLPEGRTPSEKALIAKVKTSLRPPSEGVTLLDKIRKAKAAGILTPLEGKTPEQKEKRLRDLAMHGIPLPEAKTPSEKKIIDKVRTDLGLPPEPKTATEKDNYNEGISAGIIVPLEGKTPAEKEKLLKAQAKLGILLPEGRTSSEKKLIKKLKGSQKKLKLKEKRALSPEKVKKIEAKTAKIMKEGKGPSDECICDILTPENEKKSIKPKVSKLIPQKITSEKLKAAKAAGLLTPLSGKTPAQKEKILKGLVKQGLPLPEGKTSSEKRLIDKVRADVGLPPEPKTSSGKANYARAQAAGIITPLEGKTPSQKEKILRKQAEMGVPLPEGRTPSEKALINKVKTTTVPGISTPLSGKTPGQKEKIFKGLAKQGLPLPEGKTASEKKLIDKVRADMGLPAEPKTSSGKANYAKAQAAGIITPLEGKTPSQKEKVLRKQAEMGVPLPEGRTPSEKALINKVKATTVPGISTPLSGKTPAQKEKILKGLAKQGLPLPEGKTTSEKRLIDKVRADMGLPAEPKTSLGKANYAKAQAAGIITPLEGKTPSQKKKVLRKQAEMGIPLPEGRTPSEKALINKIKATTIPSEKLRKAKLAGLLTPLQGKTPEQKEKILRDRIATGLPLPKGKTPSEKELIKKVKAATGYVSPHVGRTPSTAITPSGSELKGKTPSQKLRILRSMAKQGLQLPEGKTSSEKALISKVKATEKLPTTRVPSEMLRKAKAAGLLTPLEGKTTPEKAKILKKMHEIGIPLPEGRTPSEKSLIRKIKTSEPSTVPSEKLRAAKAAGLLTPLSGKTPAEKEKILKDLAKSGIPLPDGKTPSEKELIKKVRKEMGLPREAKSPSIADKVRKAYAAGLVTPLEGKTPAQKDKLLRDLAKAGVPLPEGRSRSEKALIKKVQAEAMARPSKRHIPPALPPEKRQKLDKKTAKVMKEGKGPSDECLCSLLTPESERTVKTPLGSVHSGKLRKAKTIGLSKPLETRKQKISKTGLSSPETKKYLEKKDRKAASLAAKRISSEKLGKIKTKSRKIGVDSTKKSAKSIGAIKKSAGIVEEFEDIHKTTTCERGCGCDKKKIRFKHSYVKIRVTSPDISSICPCPNECIPGVVSGVLTDNEGIKVTVGRALGVPSFSVEAPKNNIPTLIYINENCAKISTESIADEVIYSILSEVNTSPSKETQNSFRKSINENGSKKCLGGYRRIHNILNPHIYDFETDNETEAYNTDRYTSSQITDRSTVPSISISFISKDCSESTGSSIDSIYFLKTESSLSLSISSEDSIGKLSIMSLVDSSVVSHSSHYLYYPQTCDSDDNTEEKIYSTSQINYPIIESKVSTKSGLCDDNLQNTLYKGFTKDTDVLIFRVSGTNISKLNDKFQGNKHTDKPVLIMNDLNSDHDIKDMVDNIISNNLIGDVSSIFIVVASSENVTECSGDSSTVYIQMCENLSNWKNELRIRDKCDQNYKMISTNGFKINTRGRTSNVDRAKEKNLAVSEVKLEKNAKNILNNEISQYESKGCKVGSHVASVDTTCDRPCCCQPRVTITRVYAPSDHCVASVVSELITPMIRKQGIAQGLNDKAFLNVSGLDESMQSRYGRKQMEPTSVTSCIIPPCSGRNSCHEEETPRKKTTPLSPTNQLGTSRPCHCKQEMEPYIKRDGLNDKAFLNVAGLGESMQPRYGLKQMEPTSVTSCVIPPCSGRNSCYNEEPPRKKTSPLSPTNQLGTSRPCHCKQGMEPYIKRDGAKKFVNVGNNTQSNISPLKAVGAERVHEQSSTTDILNRLPAFKPIKNTACATCDPPISEDDKKKICVSNGKEKNVKLDPKCPCQVYDRPSSQEPIQKSKSVACQPDTKNSHQLVPELLDTCICKNKKKKKKKKNIICECPEVPDLEEFLESTPWIDEKLIRKMQSDLTQTTSGFKIHKEKSVPPEKGLSYEDIISYYKDLLAEDEGDTLVKRRGCDCEASSKKTKNIDCECPYEPPPPPPQPMIDNIPLKGLKFHIGAKGSGTKGLSGICCFDVLHENKRVVKFKSINYLT